jgi:hypothetical protein
MAVVDGVRAQAPADVDPARFLDQVAEGRVKLFDLDTEAIEIEVSRAVGRPIAIARALPPSHGSASPAPLPAPPGTREGA